MKRPPRGFTVVELLVAVAITVVLAGLGFAGYRSARDKARAAVEVNAARNLMAAYLGHAADHSGRLLGGYETDPGATNLRGETLHFPINARYPWRLAPYAPKVDGVLLFNGNERHLEHENSDYLVSVHPNLGINAVFVGGHHGSGSPLRPSERLVEAVGKYYVSRTSEAVNASELIVFASARADRDTVGNFEVRAPNLLSPDWSGEAWSESAAASDHGFVDLRWNRKAVTAQLDGSVRMLDESQLRDMRRWSNQAARLGDRDFIVGAR